MTRCNVGNDKNKKELSSTTPDRKYNNTSRSIRSSQEGDVSTSVSSSPSVVTNGFGKHDEDSDEDLENSIGETMQRRSGSKDTTKRNPGLKIFGNKHTYNGDSTVTTTGKNHTKPDSTASSSSKWRDASESQGSVSQDYLKDKTNSVSSSTAIPLPPPTSTLVAGGNSTYEFRNAAKSPSPIQTGWEQPSNNRFLEPGDIGLHNIGNTCFMNSALQCLIHSANLVEYFLKTNDLESAGPPSLSLIQAFQSVMNTAWHGSTQSMYLNDFRNVLGNIHSQFKDGRQHDCQEFLALTLDTMHEQLKKWKATVRPRMIANRVIEGEREVKHEDCGSSGDAGRSESKVSSAAFKRVVTNYGYESKFKIQTKTHPFDFDDTDENLECKIIEPSSKHKVPFNTIRKPSDPRKRLWMKLKEPFVTPTKRPIVKNYRKASELDSPVESSSKRTKLGLNNVNEASSNQTLFDWSEDSSPPEGRIQSEVNVSSTSPVASASKRLESTPLSQTEIPPKRRRESLEELSEKVDSFWNNHMSANNTVIASTFQGVYKSTVICSVCSFVSVTYEPFMYLSLPIPRTVNRELSVTFISLRDKRTFKVNVLVKLSDTMSQLKEEVAKNAPPGQSLDMTKLNDYVITEVVNYHVTKTIENTTQIKYLDDNNKNIYMYELNDNFDEKYPSPDVLPTFNIGYMNMFSSPQNMSHVSTNVRPELSAQTYLDENWDNDGPPPLVNVNGDIVTAGIPTCSPPDIPSCSTSDVNSEVSSSFVPVENGETKLRDWLMCCICQEDCPRSELKKHHCGSILCKDCTKRAAQYFERSEENTTKILGGTHLNCPICRTVVEHEKEYTPCCTQGTGPTMLMTSIVFRFDPLSDTNNNSSHATRLFGSPLTIKIPSTLPAVEFYEFINQVNPFPDLDFRVVNVGRDGTLCNQCLYTKNCKGCEFPTEGDVSLTRNSSIAICFPNISEEQIATIEPTDMATSTRTNFSFTNSLWPENEPTIDIHNCLRTFSESEILDDQNPWFCPTCKKNQCATKTMTVCRFPDYLIVYLKRFVFIEHSSTKLNNKLKFPLNDLNLCEYIAPECANNTSIYDLYSCICHFGTASAGHYTSFGKNPSTNQWHYFNDASVNEQTPSECEYSSAYVLFYHKKGIEYEIPKVKRPHTPIASPINRPIGYACPNRTYHNDGGNNRPDSTGSGSSSSSSSRSNHHHHHHLYNDGPSRVHVVDENTIGELSLSIGNSRFKDSNHAQFSSSRNELTLLENAMRVTKVLPENILDDDNEELPDIEEENDSEYGQRQEKMNWKGALSSTNSQNGFINCKLSRNRPRINMNMNNTTTSDQETKSTEN